MSHDHHKKHQGHHHDTHEKKVHHGEGEDHGKLHHAIKNKDNGDNEMTPGYEPVPANAPKDIEAQIGSAVDKDGRVRVSIVGGKNAGVMTEMPAYFIDDNGAKYSIAIDEVADKYTLGWIDGTTADHINHSSLRVMFNPSK